MSERTLKVPVDVRDVLRRLHPELKRKVRAAVTDILTHPGCGRPLKRELDGYWSLMVGRHRLIHRPDSAGAEIAAFGPRRTIYEDMARAMARRRAG